MTFEAWFEDNKKYIYGADVDAWCEAAYKAGLKDGREECAVICDEIDKESQSQWPQRIATMIRARSDK